MSPAASRIAVVGLGAVSQAVHLPLLQRCSDRFRLVGITDIAPNLVRDVGDRFNVPQHGRFDSTEDMLDRSGADAVLICSGGSHTQDVCAALGRSLRVLCEKPLALTLGEIDRIAAASPPADADVPLLMVGYMKQYDPAVLRARDLLRGITDLRSVNVTVLHPTGQAQLDFANLVKRRGGAPADDAKSAAAAAQAARLHRQAIGGAPVRLWTIYSGCIMSSLAHDLSILRMLTGAPEAIDFVDIWHSDPRSYRHPVGRDAAALGAQPTSVRAAGVLPHGQRCVMDWHYLPDFPAYSETVSITHGAGKIELRFPSPYLLNTPTVLTVIEPDRTSELRTEIRSTEEAF